MRGKEKRERETNRTWRTSCTSVSPRVIQMRQSFRFLFFCLHRANSTNVLRCEFIAAMRPSMEGVKYADVHACEGGNDDDDNDAEEIDNTIDDDDVDDDDDGDVDDDDDGDAVCWRGVVGTEVAGCREVVLVGVVDNDCDNTNGDAVC